MTNPKPPTAAGVDRGYTDDDLAEVSDNPEWTAEEIRTAKPLSALMPELAGAIRRTRGAQKAPTKQLISLRLDREVVDTFKAGGRGWQSRMGTALCKAAGLED